MLDLEEAISEMKIIHVAGTKGKVLKFVFMNTMKFCFALYTSNKKLN